MIPQPAAGRPRARCVFQLPLPPVAPNELHHPRDRSQLAIGPAPARSLTFWTVPWGSSPIPAPPLGGESDLSGPAIHLESHRIRVRIGVRAHVLIPRHNVPRIRIRVIESCCACLVFHQAGSVKPPQQPKSALFSAYWRVRSPVSSRSRKVHCSGATPQQRRGHQKRGIIRRGR